jgi:hypothetical protein
MLLFGGAAMTARNIVGNVPEPHDLYGRDDFLAWFRTVRLERKDKLRRHRFIVGGSTGIDLILRRLNAPDKLNDFERLYVEPISEAYAVWPPILPGRWTWTSATN